MDSEECRKIERSSMRGIVALQSDIITLIVQTLLTSTLPSSFSVSTHLSEGEKARDPSRLTRNALQFSESFSLNTLALLVA